MATRAHARPAAPRPSRRPRAAAAAVAAPLPRSTSAITPDVVRSIVGTVLLVLGAITLIALIAARPGRPDGLVARRDRAVVRDRALAAAVPAARRRLVRRAGPGQAARAPLGHDPARALDRLRRRASGAFQVLASACSNERAAAGSALPRDASLEPLLAPRPARSSLLVALALVGLLLAFDLPLRAAAHAGHRHGALVGTTAAASRAGASRLAGRRGAGQGEAGGRGERQASVACRSWPGSRRRDARPTRSILDEPAPAAARPGPISQTVWTGRSGDGRRRRRSARHRRDGAAGRAPSATVLDRRRSPTAELDA